MHLLTTEAGMIAKSAVGLIGALLQKAPGINEDGARRLSEAVRGRLEAEGDRIGLEAYQMFEQDPVEYRVPLTIVVANKANQDSGYRANLLELVQAAAG